MKTCFLALFTLLLVTARSLAQPPDTLWTHSYGGTNLDDAYGVATTTDGGFFIVGRSRSFSEQFDIWLVRTDAVGDTLWTRTYGGNGYDHAAAVCENGDGGAMIVGWTQSFGVGGMDMYLINTAADGDTLWTRTFGTASSDYAHAVARTTDGSFIVGGSMFVTAHSLDAVLMKVSASGTILWTHTYGAVNVEEAYSVCQTDDGGYLFGGRAVPQGASRPDMYAVRTDADGDTIWTRRFGTDNWEEASGIVETADGGCAMGGWQQITEGGNNNFYVVKVSATGEQQWARAYGGPGFERGYAFQQSTDGGYIIAGSTTSYGAGGNDFYFVKIDSDGDTLWTRTNGGPSSEYLYDLRVTDDGGYIGIGSSASFGNGSIDYWAVRLPGFAGVGGYVRNMVTGDPLANVWVGAVGQAHRTKSDAVGHYVLTLPPGASYDVHTSGACVARDTVFNVPIFEDSITVQDINIGVPIGDVPRTSMNIVAHNRVAGSDSFRVYNRGLGVLDVNVTLETYVPPTPWLSVNPAITQVNPGDSVDIVVTVLSDTTDDGVFDFVGALTVHMNSCPDSAIHIDVIATILDAEESVTLPTSYELSAYPNPFNPTATLEFALPRAEQATLVVYDVMGREVQTLQQGLLTAGTHRVIFDAAELTSGLYFARLQTPSTTLTKKLLLIR